jgi:hypothetical protein
VQRGANNQPLPGRPVEETGLLPHANVIADYNFIGGKWNNVTQYPTDKPVTDAN